MSPGVTEGPGPEVGHLTFLDDFDDPTQRKEVCGVASGEEVL